MVAKDVAIRSRFLEGRDIVKINEGALDRTLRVIAGIALIALTLTGAISAWGWIGIVPLATGAVGLCPLYSLLGISTCPVKKSA